MEIVNQILIPVLEAILTIVFSYVAIKIKNYLENKEISEEVKTVINDTVKYVEQVYKDLDGEQKLQNAISNITKLLEEKGITISQEEMRTLIESAVYNINQMEIIIDEDEQEEE